ncbi:hypothetical protein BOX15_Mlig021688g1 [Macrostomum lignano]|uniref:Ubiquitin-like domain-containing protein n=1 Tax=Macrostomum lignano TaxID=282301 RepID=A0A267E4S3_9PLAT|nr:hypothetical protein BOX15_Mlig021688g1 [Macrostomum lignano]
MPSLTVKQLRGGEHTIELPDGASLNELHRAVSEAFGCPPANQRLMLRGRPLLVPADVADASLSSLGVRNGDRLVLVVKEAATSAESSGPAHVAAAADSSNVGTDKPSASSTTATATFADLLRRRVVRDNPGMAPADADSYVAMFSRALAAKVDSLSLDDIERLCANWPTAVSQG